MDEIPYDVVHLDFIKAVMDLPDDQFNNWEHPVGLAEKYLGGCRVTENRVYVTIGGSEIRDNMHGGELIDFLDHYGWKITRLDFCVDLYAPFSFKTLYGIALQAYVDSEYRTKHGKVGHSEPKPTMFESPNGCTVYIGKRHSERMLRVYNKRGEILEKRGIDIGFPLTRIEIEVKGRLVDAYKALFMTGQSRAIIDDIQARYPIRIDSQRCAVHIDHRNDEKSDPFAVVERYSASLRNAWDIDHCKFMKILGLELEEVS